MFKLLYILLFFLLFFFDSCNGQSNQKIEIRNEYIILYKKGIPHDTTLKKKSYYDITNKLVKEEVFYNSRIFEVVKYFYNESDESKYLKLKDSVVYVVKNNEVEKRFFNGSVIDLTYYNRRGDVLKEIIHSYNLNNSPLIEKNFFYDYKDGKKNYETLVINNDTDYKAKYTYTKDSASIEKYFIFNKCCEGNQPIPPDKIIYQYDKNKRLVKELEVTDKTIKRQYKDENDGYYNEVVITTYDYDKQGKLIDKKTYIPNFTTDDIKIENLFNAPKSLSKEYIYK